MKISNIRSKLFIVLGIIFTLTIIKIANNKVGNSAAAASASFYFSPGSDSINKGETTTLTLHIIPGTSINGVTASVTYDPAKLQFTAMDGSTSAFDASYGSAGGGGTLSINRVKNGGTVSSDSVVVKISFKALSGSGSDSVAVTGRATSAGSYISPNPSGDSATITLTTPSSGGGGGGSTGGGSSGGGSTGGGSTGGGSSGGGTSSTAKKKPIAVEASATSVEYSKATVRLTAKSSFKAYVEYGTSQKFGYSTKSVSANKKTNVALNSKYLHPATAYLYRAVSVGSDGQQTVGHTHSFITQGFTVLVRLIDGSSNPVANKEVTLRSDPINTTTSSDGVAQFTGVQPGVHHLEFDKDGTTVSKPLVVDNNVKSVNGKQVADPQSVDIAYDTNNNVVAKPSNSNKGLIIAGVLALAIIVILVTLKTVVMNKSKFHGTFASNDQMNNQMPPISTAPPAEPTQPSGPDLIDKVKGVSSEAPGSVVEPKDPGSDIPHE